MKRFLKWTGIVIGVGFASMVAYDGVQKMRTKLRSSLDRVDAITDKAQQLVEETHNTVHAAKQAI